MTDQVYDSKSKTNDAKSEAANRAGRLHDCAYGDLETRSLITHQGGGNSSDTSLTFTNPYTSVHDQSAASTMKGTSPESQVSPSKGATSSDKTSKTSTSSQATPSESIQQSETTSQQLQQKLDKAAQDLAQAKTTAQKNAALAEIVAIDKSAVGNLQTLLAAEGGEFTELSKPYPAFTAASNAQLEAATNVDTQIDKLTPAQYKALGPDIANYLGDTASQQEQFEQKLSAQGLSGLSDALKNLGTVVANTDAALAPGEHIEATLNAQFGPSLTSAREAILRTLKLEDTALRESGESPQGHNELAVVDQSIQDLTKLLASADPDGDGQ